MSVKRYGGLRCDRNNISLLARRYKLIKIYLVNSLKFSLIRGPRYQFLPLYSAAEGIDLTRVAEVVTVGGELKERACDSLVMCIVTTLNQGLRNGGGIGDILRAPSSTVRIKLVIILITYVNN